MFFLVAGFLLLQTNYQKTNVSSMQLGTMNVSGVVSMLREKEKSENNEKFAPPNG